MEISSYLCIRFPQGRLFFEFYDRLMDRGQAASGACFFLMCIGGLMKV